MAVPKNHRKNEHRGKALLAFIMLPMVLRLSGSGHTSALVPPVIYQGNRMDTEERVTGRNDTAVWTKNRLHLIADLVRSHAGRGDEAVGMENIHEEKPMASQFHSSAPTQGTAEFLPLKDEWIKKLKLDVTMPGNKSTHHNMTYSIRYHSGINSGSSDSEQVDLMEVLVTSFAAAIVVCWISICMNIKLLMSKWLGPKTYLLIGIAIVLSSSTHVRSQPWHHPPIPLFLNVRGSYEPFFNDMHAALEFNTQPVDGHFILPPEQDGIQFPFSWISVEVRGADIEHSALMYFRADTVYFLGFMNNYGTLYCTDDAVDKFPNGCTPLGFKGNYNDLTERPDPSLDLGLFMQDANLGREGAQYAADILAEWGVMFDSPSLVKNAMLTFAIMISEAIRFKPIGDLIKQNWEQRSVVLTKEMGNLVFVWQDLSILWCRLDDRTVDQPEWRRAIERLWKANINTREDVRAALDYVKCEKQCRVLRHARVANPNP